MHTDLSSDVFIWAQRGNMKAAKAHRRRRQARHFCSAKCEFTSGLWLQQLAKLLGGQAGIFCNAPHGQGVYRVVSGKSGGVCRQSSRCDRFPLQCEIRVFEKLGQPAFGKSREVLARPKP